MEVAPLTKEALKIREPLILDTLKANGCVDTAYMDAWLWFPPDDYPLGVWVGSAPRIANLFILTSKGGVDTLCTIRIGSDGGYELVRKSAPMEPGVLVWLNGCFRNNHLLV